MKANEPWHSRRPAATATSVPTSSTSSPGSTPWWGSRTRRSTSSRPCSRPRTSSRPPGFASTPTSRRSTTTRASSGWWPERSKSAAEATLLLVHRVPASTRGPARPRPDDDGGCRMGRRTAVVTAWCLAIGLVPPLVPRAKAQSYTTVSAYQVRMCRSEADRRLPTYSYDQIEAAQVQAPPDTRDRDAATIRWRAGSETGICTVSSSGNILSFTRDDPGASGTSSGTTTRITCESRHTERVECRIPTGARVKLARQLSDNPCRLNDSYAQTADYIWVSG